MDKDDIIRQFDRQLRIRAMFAFERRKASAAQLEREFAQAALELVQRQPAMAESLGVPSEFIVDADDHEA